MELAEITAALEGNAELLNGITSFVLDTDKGKEVITNKAESIFQTRISDEISGVHSQYDNDAFDILGEKPKVLDDGKKQKTYDFLKERLTELKTLRGQKDDLNVDAQIIKLNAQIEDLKKNGGGAHWEQTFNTEKAKWKTEREDLIKQATSAEGNIANFQKKSDIEAGLRGLKFNDDVPEAARKALVDNVVNNLINNSKIEDGKVIYLDDKGGVINDNEYKPQSAAGILKNSLKDILKNENTDGGGGAPTTITGSIETTKVDGKDDVKRLILQEGSFKTKTEFLAKAEEALLKAGITRTNTKDWDALKNEAYKRYQVGNLPR
jgi:hypothetical protein